MKKKRTKYSKLTLRLHWQERKRVKKLLKASDESRGVLRRARILDLLDQGYGTTKVSKLLEVDGNTVRKVGWRYLEEGLDGALYERERPGAERVLEERESNEIIAMVCSEPPEGYARWSIRLITEEAKKREIANVSRETIRILLKSHDLKPWLKKNVVRGGAGW